MPGEPTKRSVSLPRADTPSPRDPKAEAAVAREQLDLVVDPDLRKAVEDRIEEIERGDYGDCGGDHDDHAHHAKEQ